MVSDQIAAFLSFVRDAENQYNSAYKAEEKANLETQDILHFLELNAHTYKERAKVAGKLAKVRKRRREARDATMLYGPVCEWAEQNKAVLKALERLLGDVRKTESIQRNRAYLNKTTILDE